MINPPLPWVKLPSDLWQREDMRLVGGGPEGEFIQLLFVKLLCLAGRANDGGRLTFSGRPYSVQTLSILFQKPEGIIQVALDTLAAVGSLTRDEAGAWKVADWETAQFCKAIEEHNVRREQTRIRNIHYRERKRLEAQRQLGQGGDEAGDELPGWKGALLDGLKGTRKFPNLTAAGLVNAVAGLDGSGCWEKVVEEARNLASNVVGNPVSWISARLRKLVNPPAAWGEGRWARGGVERPAGPVKRSVQARSLKEQFGEDGEDLNGGGRQ